MVSQTEAALRERVKELSCLYGIAQIAGKPGISLEEILQQIVELLPPAWQYPDILEGRVILDGKVFATAGFWEDGDKQRSEIVVSGNLRGTVEVVYLAAKPELDEGPFLKEERNLIDAIARQVTLIIEQKEMEAEKARLQEQLLHADRLATIGQLAAGVAHELNEPLGNILGFAQLAKKAPQVPEQVEQDLMKIEKASLHAREITRKLLVFARQAPSSMTQVTLNQLIDDGLYFLESRCAKAGIELVREIAPDLPEIQADPSQLNQVFVNLVVNSIQAMPEGGKLTITVAVKDDMVFISIGDTGCGMDKEALEKIFLPFFTTKDIGEGTGLGLSLVHGIVTSHGGTIEVESEVGKGTRFEIRLPIKKKKDMGEHKDDGSA